MDMKTPDMLGSVALSRTLGKLEDVAAALGCSTGLFFETSDGPSTGQTAQLLQMWLVIRSPEDRQLVLACVREILKVQSENIVRRQTTEYL
ncbi:hypothetical protein MKL09_08465 [Methylobacterium sp. J-048]|uniref:hypothetical protein n=1 Tax=Methylobacterium sp. J-048 TaxID=2836635 RepID=UPI001FB89988|nr:hypothetical protein [Methylobacterium sp. J-048]MCJ2056586.1 hypothetical protein [Methylobacterium sp. J-048]